MTTPKERSQMRGRVTVAHHDYQQAMNRHAFFKVHDNTLGQDLVQETFTKTWVYLLKGGKIDIMKAFLYHVLHDLIVDEYRKHKTTSLDALLEKGFELGGEETNRLLNKLDGHSAILLIKKLPEKYQKIMRMRFIQELSLQEISTLTGQSKNAIAVQVHRGLQKLRSLYPED